MLQWVAEYWDDAAKGVVCYNCTTLKWRQCPAGNVLMVYVVFPGQKGFGKLWRDYRIRLKGYDNYYLQKREDGSVIFGGWNDDPKIPGSLFTWTPDGWVKRVAITSRPDGIADNDVKAGVWVNEPWAAALGLTSLDGLRTIAGCHE